jgi:hypothetical protein
MGKLFYLANRLPLCGLCIMYGRKFSLVLFIRRECVRGACCINLLILHSEQGILHLESGATRRSPSDSWGLYSKQKSLKQISEFGGHLSWFPILKKIILR